MFPARGGKELWNSLLRCSERVPPWHIFRLFCPLSCIFLQNNDKNYIRIIEEGSPIRQFSLPGCPDRCIFTIKILFWFSGGCELFRYFCEKSCRNIWFVFRLILLLHPLSRNNDGKSTKRVGQWRKETLTHRKKFRKKVKKVLEDKGKKFYLCIRKTKKRPTEVMGNYKRDLWGNGDRRKGKTGKALQVSQFQPTDVLELK